MNKKSLWFYFWCIVFCIGVLAVLVGLIIVFTAPTEVVGINRTYWDSYYYETKMAEAGEIGVKLFWYGLVAGFVSFFGIGATL